MATRDSLVFAAKIFDYLETREKELADKIDVNQEHDEEFWRCDGAYEEVSALLDWLCEH